MWQQDVPDTCLQSRVPCGKAGCRCSLICQWLIELWISHLTSMSMLVHSQEESGDHAHTQSLYTPGGEAHAEHQHCNRDNLQRSIWGNKSFSLYCTGFYVPSVWRMSPQLLQILTEQVCTQVVHKPHLDPDSTVKIQNPSKPISCFLNYGLFWNMA